MARFYENCEQLDQEGRFLSFINKKRADWYVNRGLAKVLSHEPYRISLTFPPAGQGRREDPFYQVQRENVCVVCGTEESLTRHHVVPQTFRKHFPEEFKANANHDVLAACETCHRAYCVFEEELKVELAKKHDLSLTGAPLGIPAHIQKAASLAQTASARWDSMGTKGKERIAASFLFLFSSAGPTPDEMKQIVSIHLHQQTSSFGKAIANLYEDDLNSLASLWRNHFVETMDPQHLPKFWDPNRELG
jgi:exonuclease 3'-5' domain-containing protein 2